MAEEKFGFDFPCNSQYDWTRAVRMWHRYMLHERADSALPECVHLRLIQYYSDAGLYRFKRQIFYERHYGDTLALSAAYLFDESKLPHILDLGCGLGSQALFFALHGANVTALDCDADALAVLEHRKKRLEEISGKSLSVNYVYADIKNDNIAAETKFDGVFSMFAWNMMQPSSAVLKDVLAASSLNARFAILDGNNLCWRSRLLKRYQRAVWTPHEMEENFKQFGVRRYYHQGAVSIPPIFWYLFGSRFCRGIDRILCKNLLFPVSHLLLAQRIC